MINSIIFDFGDIFINLDKQATLDGLKNLGLQQWNKELDENANPIDRLVNMIEANNFKIMKKEEKEMPSLPIVFIAILVICLIVTIGFLIIGY